MAPRMMPSILNWAEASVGCSSTRPPTNTNPAVVQIEDLPNPCMTISRFEPHFFLGFCGGYCPMNGLLAINRVAHRRIRQGIDTTRKRPESAARWLGVARLEFRQSGWAKAGRDLTSQTGAKFLSWRHGR